MHNAENRLLIVDDEPAICAVIERVAAPLGFVVRSLSQSAQFRETLQDFAPSVLILDLKMPDCDGVQLLQHVRDSGCGAHVIVISGMDQRVLNTAEKLGRSQGLKMLGVLQKPLRRADLERHLQQALSLTKIFSRADLQAAMSNREFVVHYQPKVSRQTGRWIIDGAEALVRWKHPSHGLLLPGDFLPLVEECGLMGSLTDLILESAVQQLARWSKRRMPVKVAVNVSACLIEDLAFPDRLGSLLRENDVPGSLLALELTESRAMADAIKGMDIFLRLCMNDVGLSIDDFGTGFSSLQQLYQLPFDELKIDRMFVGGLPGDEEARAIVRAIVDMAHALNMKVCAEGVETREALEYLEAVNCDRAQGFLISPAVPAAEFERVMTTGDFRAPGDSVEETESQACV